ncbi:antibiotic biosynthesis monooxygenase [Clostridioides difficile]|nr:antibiotic biosynthesis monooxygenase [Clostridioides difficile]
MQDYIEQAEKLKKHLQNAEGFMCSERFSSLASKEKLLSMSVWKDEESISKWRNFIAQRESQQQGRLSDFIDYKITVVSQIRCYTMADRKKHLNSNQYFNI